MKVFWHSWAPLRLMQNIVLIKNLKKNKNRSKIQARLAVLVIESHESLKIGKNTAFFAKNWLPFHNWIVLKVCLHEDWCNKGWWLIKLHIFWQLMKIWGFFGCRESQNIFTWPYFLTLKPLYTLSIYLPILPPINWLIITGRRMQRKRRKKGRDRKAGSCMLFIHPQIGEE